MPVSLDSCLIVGGGLCGLLAARELAEAGVEVTVLEESYSVGGRMATRRSGGAVFDHGAQFFTVRGERFGALVDGWLRAGAAAEWSRGFPKPGESAPDGYPRYRGAEGMASIPRHLATGLDVRPGECVTRVEKEGERWRIFTQTGGEYSSAALLLTPPAPQSLALAQSGGFRLAQSDQRQLAEIAYDPCLALMARLDGDDSPVPQPGGLQIKSEPLDWISDNRLKSISPSTALTIHAGPAYSRDHYEFPEQEIARELISLAEEALKTCFAKRVTETRLQHWRYSWVTHPHPEPCFATDSRAPLVFAGDGFGQPKVEGAALSGLAAADLLLQRSHS